LSEWLAEDHLAWFALDACRSSTSVPSTRPIAATAGAPLAHDPQMMVALLVYASAIGERSSRAIERRCREDVAFGVIMAIYFESLRRVSTRCASRTASGSRRGRLRTSRRDFGQRFKGTLSDDGRTIAGAWEIRHEGKPWALDFKLTYTRV
jgi:Transposase domain (DUF772)